MPKRKDGKPKKPRKLNEKFMRPLKPSAQLAAVVGEKPLSRTEVVKRIWTYIKSKGLQDKVDRRSINADAALRPLFGKDKVSMFELTKIVSSHLSAA